MFANDMLKGAYVYTVIFGPIRTKNMPYPRHAAFQLAALCTRGPCASVIVNLSLLTYYCTCLASVNELILDERLCIMHG